MARTHEGMNYRQIQLWNKEHLTTELDRERKKKGLKNLGWEFVIALYQWVKERTPNSHSLEQLTRKASQLKDLETGIKRVIHSVIDHPFEPTQKPLNNISTLIR